MNPRLFRLIVILITMPCISFNVFADELSSGQGSTTSTITPGKKPVYIEADYIDGSYGEVIDAFGNARISCGDTVITADRMKLSKILMMPKPKVMCVSKNRVMF